MNPMDTAYINIDTEAELYPQIVISPAKPGTGHVYEVPAALLEARRKAAAALHDADEAILRAAGWWYDDVEGWQRPRRATPS